MTLTLSTTLDRYFVAQNAHDADGMVACFAPGAHVHDERRDYRGAEEIRGWKVETIAKYGISIEPLSIAEQDDRSTVVARVTGNFPGSPANLTYTFGFDETGLIKSLEIH